MVRNWPPSNLYGASVLSAIVAAGLALVLLVALLGPLALVVVIGAVLVPVAIVRAPGVVLAAYLLIPFYKAAVNDLLPVDLTIVLAALNALQAIVLIRHRPEGRMSTAGPVLWIGMGLLLVGGILYAPDQ